MVFLNQPLHCGFFVDICTCRFALQIIFDQTFTTIKSKKDALSQTVMMQSPAPEGLREMVENLIGVTNTKRPRLFGLIYDASAVRSVEVSIQVLLKPFKNVSKVNGILGYKILC